MIDFEAPEISTGLSTLWPPSFCQTRDLRLMIANGLMRPLIYEPLQGAVNAGIVAPAAGPTGTPASGGACTAGDYVIGYRYKDAVNGTYSSLSPLTTVTVTADQKINWSGLTASAEARVTHKELWRSTAGQSGKFYLIATVANATTTYTSDTDSDDTLGTDSTDDEILDLETADKQLWARRQVVPPNYMKVCFHFQDRTFWCASAIYDVGTVSIENGSATLTGSGTAWTDALEGRKVYLIGGDKAYTVETVGSTTSITLSDNYAGTTLSGARYAIMPDPRLWGNTLIWSEQDEPESVPATQNTLGVQESLASDNDWVVGGLAHGTQAWILKTRHVYSVTFARQPKLDVGVHLRFDRGAFNHRCADYLVDTLYLMDALGPWAIGQGDTYVPLGPPIQDYFRDRRVDFGKRDWWFVSCSPSEKVVRFCVTLEGQAGNQPKTALCYGTESDKWWKETYQEGLGGSTRVEHLGKVRTVVGGSYDRLLLLGDANSEGVSCQGAVTAATTTTLSDSTQSPFTNDMEGYEVTIIRGTGSGQVRTIETCESTSQVTVDEAWETTPDTTSRYALPYAIRGTATAADSTSITDSGKTFSAQLAGGTVSILSGTGAGQLRYIKTAAATKLTVTSAWTTTPSTDSVYLVGAIECTYRTGILEIPAVDELKRGEDENRAVELTYEPTTVQQDVDWRLLWDHLLTGDENWLDFSQAGLSTERGGVNKRIDLQSARSSLASAPGMERVSFSARNNRRVQTHRFLSSELHWFAGEEAVKLYNLEVS